MGVTGFVHTGVVVEDLARAVAFFTTLGLECSQSFTVEGDWVGRIIALPGARVEAVMVRLADGTDTLELVKFHTPSAVGDAEAAPPNHLGIRHLACRVDDLRATVNRVRTAGGHAISSARSNDGREPRSGWYGRS